MHEYMREDAGFGTDNMCTVSVATCFWECVVGQSEKEQLAEQLAQMAKRKVGLEVELLQIVLGLITKAGGTPPSSTKFRVNQPSGTSVRMRKHVGSPHVAEHRSVGVKFAPSTFDGLHHPPHEIGCCRRDGDSIDNGHQTTSRQVFHHHHTPSRTSSACIETRA